jgi:hypothetical protein
MRLIQFSLGVTLRLMEWYQIIKSCLSSLQKRGDEEEERGKSATLKEEGKKVFLRQQFLEAVN